MMAALEAGAEDVESAEDGHVIWTRRHRPRARSRPRSRRRSARRSSTKLVWRPQTTTELDLEAAQSLMRLIEALEDDDDVQSVTANFEISDEVMAQL